MGEAESSRERFIALAPEVIVVDDDTAVLELMRLLIEGSGMRVRVFGSVRHAIEAAAHRAADVVLTDLCLDGERGEDLAEALRSDPNQRHTRLVAITGLAEPCWETVRLFDAYLRKPMDTRLVVDVLRHFASTASVERCRAQVASA